MLKLLNVFVTTGLWVLGMILVRGNIKHLFVVSCVFVFVVLNVNDLIITSFIFGHTLVFYIAEEIWFYVRNRKDVKKVLRKLK